MALGNDMRPAKHGLPRQQEADHVGRSLQALAQGVFPCSQELRDLLGALVLGLEMPGETLPAVNIGEAGAFTILLERKSCGVQGHGQLHVAGGKPAPFQGIFFIHIYSKDAALRSRAALAFDENLGGDAGVAHRGDRDILEAVGLLGHRNALDDHQSGGDASDGLGVGQGQRGANRGGHDAGGASNRAGDGDRGLGVGEGDQLDVSGLVLDLGLIRGGVDREAVDEDAGFGRAAEGGAGGRSEECSGHSRVGCGS